MTKENTTGISLEDRFYDFVTKDFPDFRAENSKQLADVKAQVKGAHSRLKRIEERPNSVPPLVGTNGSTFKRLFSQYKYYIALVLLGCGFWLGSRGDTEGTIRMLGPMSDALIQMGLRVSQIEKNKTEPVFIPVPVSSEDMLLE